MNRRAMGGGENVWDVVARWGGLPSLSADNRQPCNRYFPWSEAHINRCGAPKDQHHSLLNTIVSFLRLVRLDSSRGCKERGRNT